MKKITLITLLLITNFLSAQDYIKVNDTTHLQSTYPIEELLAKVLVKYDALDIKDIEYQLYNDDDLKRKSFGYFDRGDLIDFPFKNGIILTNGYAYNAVDDQTQQIGTLLGLPSDADFEQTLNLQETKDVNFIKFKFKAPVDSFSFDYILASQEYRHPIFTCEVPDAIAFLIRPVGETKYTNFAVLPNGDDVRVDNINITEKCAKNEEYFEEGEFQHTTYPGRTKVLTAIFNLEKGKEYELKFGIADIKDHIYDTALFIDAESFGFTLSDEDFTMAKHFKISPNPTNGLINLEALTNFDKSTITLSDVNGRIVLSKTITFNSGTEKQLNINHLNPGLYFLSIANDQFTLFDKIVKN